MKGNCYNPRTSDDIDIELGSVNLARETKNHQKGWRRRHVKNL